MPKNKKPTEYPESSYDDLIDEFDGPPIEKLKVPYKESDMDEYLANAFDNDSNDRTPHLETTKRSLNHTERKQKLPPLDNTFPGSLEMWKNVKKYTSEEFDAALNKMEKKQASVLGRLEKESKKLETRTENAMNKFFSATGGLSVPQSDIDRLIKETQNTVANETALPPAPTHKPRQRG